jgi:hypothetical protein
LHSCQKCVINKGRVNKNLKIFHFFVDKRYTLAKLTFSHSGICYPLLLIILFSVLKDIKLWNYMVFWYKNSQFTLLFLDNIHIVHTLFIYVAFPYSLQVYMVLFCVHFRWLFLWWAPPVLARAWKKSRYWDTREDSHTLS